MQTPPRPQKPVEVFILCSPADKKLLDKLKTGLAVLKNQGYISVSDSSSIEAGEEAATEVSRLMGRAGIILPLVSSEFMASDECWGADMMRAFNRHERDETRLIPVILRPCDWEESAFGRLAVLPEGARPVSRWATHEDAFASVVKSIRSRVAGGVEVGTPKPPGGLQRQVSNLLPCLCNRVAQEEILSGIFSAENVGRRRPFLLVVHGDEDEGHYEYKLRLKGESLPRLLGKGASVKLSAAEFFLPFSADVRSPGHGFRRLHDALVQNVTSKFKASEAEVATALSQFRQPVMIYSYLGTESWEPHGPGIIERFINYWSNFPDLSPATRLIVCLFIMYRKAEWAEGGRYLDGSLRARAYLDKLDLSGFGGVIGGVLPEMESVPLLDAENYFHHPRWFAEICDRHTPSFCDEPRAVEEIGEYYRAYHEKVRGDAANLRVPMAALAKELRRVIEKNLC